MPITIPKNHESAVKALIRLSDDQLEALAQALSSAQPSLSVRSLAEQVGPKVPLDQSDLLAILVVLVALYSTKEHADFTDERLAGEVTKAAVARGLGLDSQDAVERFRAMVARLLSFDATIGVSAKAQDVLLEHENPFVSARILTDMRPVFSGRERPVATGGVIVHMLKLSTSGKNEAVFIALDTMDLRTLQGQIDRAIRKEDSLREVIQRCGLTYFEPRGEQ